MRVATLAWLIVCLAAQQAHAQVPTDPLAGNLPGTPDSAAARAVDANLPPPYVTRQSDVEIPFSVKPGAGPEAQPTAVRVFVSWDRGQTWHFYDERRPEEGRFRFRPRQDGEYWFATQTIDRSGRADGGEPRQPQLRLVVDTQRPQLLVQAQVDAAGQVHVAWSATDANLAPPTLKIEYQDAAETSGNWLPVEAPAASGENRVTQAAGQATFRPQVASRAINLRAEIADAAGNVAYYSRHLSLEPPPPAEQQGPPPDPTATRWQPDVPATPLTAGRPSPQPATQQVPAPNVLDNPYLATGRLASQPRQPSAEALPAPAPAASPAINDWEPRERAVTRGSQFPLEAQPPAEYGHAFEPLPPQSAAPPGTPSLYGDTPPTEYRPSPEPSPALDWPGHAVPQYGFDEPPQPQPEIMPTPAPRHSEPVEAPHGQRPRLTNSRRFALEYDIESVGPEGVLAVELWGTTDGGRTWIKWGADPDRTSPFDVEVNSEAVYGFRIVIVGKNGLATSTPQPGDAADIWVQVDLTRPAARLTGAAYGQGPAAGKLDIRWEADDQHLGSRPVTLLISDRPDGSFTPIVAGLPNTGQYLWEFDPRSPRQIYLRLEVRDEAGNVAIDQLTEPIRIEGLQPKGRIRGFQAGPEPIHGAFRSPLFR
jgi:hypothetical protein